MNLLPEYSATTLDRVHHCDALTLLRALPSDFCECIVTDPPYGIGDVVSARRLPEERFKDVANNNKIYATWLKDLHRVAKPSAAVYMFASWKNFAEWRTKLETVGFIIRDCLVWDKVIHGSSGLTTHYGPQHEFIIYAIKEYHYINYPRPTNILRFQRVNPMDLKNPYEKPVSLIERLIRVSSNPGDIILDPFIGSGTTAVAARNLGRHFIGCDISPEYVAIARDRLALPFTLPMFANPQTGA